MLYSFWGSQLGFSPWATRPIAAARCWSRCSRSPGAVCYVKWWWLTMYDVYASRGKTAPVVVHVFWKHAYVTGSGEVGCVNVHVNLRHMHMHVLGWGVGGVNVHVNLRPESTAMWTQNWCETSGCGNGVGWTFGGHWSLFEEAHGDVRVRKTLRAFSRANSHKFPLSALQIPGEF